MQPEQRKDFEQRKELGDRLNSVMAHPEWSLVQILIEEEIRMHSNKAKSLDFRHDPSQYANIVRALDNADALQAVLDKFSTVLRLGQEARKKLDAADRGE